MDTNKAIELAQELQTNIEEEFNNNSTYIYYDWLPAIRHWLYLVDRLVVLMEGDDNDS